MLRQQTNKQTCSLPHRQHLKRALGSRFDTLLLDFKCNLFKIIKSCLKCYFNDFFFYHSTYWSQFRWWWKWEIICVDHICKIIWVHLKRCCVNNTSNKLADACISASLCAYVRLYVYVAHIFFPLYLTKPKESLSFVDKWTLSH